MKKLKLIAIKMTYCILISLFYLTNIQGQSHFLPPNSKWLRPLKTCQELGLDSVFHQKGDTLICLCRNDKNAIFYLKSLTNTFLNQCINIDSMGKKWAFYDDRNLLYEYDIRKHSLIVYTVDTSNGHVEQRNISNEGLVGLSNFNNNDRKGIRDGLWIEYWAAYQKSSNKPLKQPLDTLSSSMYDSLMINARNYDLGVKSKGHYMPYSIQIEIDMDKKMAYIKDCNDTILESFSINYVREEYQTLIKKYDFPDLQPDSERLRSMEKHFKIGEWYYWDYKGNLERIEYYDKGKLIKVDKF